MKVPTFTESPVVQENGNWTDSWGTNIRQLLQNMNEDLSEEGYRIPSISSNPSSVSPPETGGQLLQIQNSFGLQQGVQVGTLIFDPYEINGGNSENPLGQLKVLLNDGTFHKITNL